MLLVTLVLGVSCLSFASAAPVPDSVNEHFQNIYQKMDLMQMNELRMQMEINKLKSATIPKSAVGVTNKTCSLALSVIISSTTKVKFIQCMLVYSIESSPRILNYFANVSAAFSTRLHESTTIGDSPVIFGTVDLNIGDGYDEFTGVFQPPLNGVNVLTVYAVSTGGNSGPMYIKNNDDSLCQANITQSGYADTGTCTAIVELTVGDSVRVTGDSSNPAGINDVFSGFVGHYIGSI